MDGHLSSSSPIGANGRIANSNLHYGAVSKGALSWPRCIPPLEGELAIKNPAQGKQVFRCQSHLNRWCEYQMSKDSTDVGFGTSCKPSHALQPKVMGIKVGAHTTCH